MAELEKQYRRHPRWSVQLHCDNLTSVPAERPEQGEVPSYQTIRRRMRENGWGKLRVPAAPTIGQRRAADRLAVLEVWSFEVAPVHALWHRAFRDSSILFQNPFSFFRQPVFLFTACSFFRDGHFN